MKRRAKSLVKKSKRQKYPTDDIWTHLDPVLSHLPQNIVGIVHGYVDRDWFRFNHPFPFPKWHWREWNGALISFQHQMIVSKHHSGCSMWDLMSNMRYDIDTTPVDDRMVYLPIGHQFYRLGPYLLARFHNSVIDVFRWDCALKRVQTIAPSQGGTLVHFFMLSATELIIFSAINSTIYYNIWQMNAHSFLRSGTLHTQSYIAGITAISMYDGLLYLGDIEGRITQFKREKDLFTQCDQVWVSAQPIENIFHLSKTEMLVSTRIRQTVNNQRVYYVHLHNHLHNNIELALSDYASYQTSDWTITRMADQSILLKDGKNRWELTEKHFIKK